MSNPNQVAQAIYQATDKELSAAHDPALKREVLKELDAIYRSGDLNSAHITSAVELSPDEKQLLEAKLIAKFNRPLVYEYHVDTSLLGGVVAKVGDKIIDGSVVSKLNAMQETLLGGLR